MKKLIALLMAFYLSGCNAHVDAPDAYWVIPATEKLDCCLHVDNLPGSPLMLRVGYNYPFSFPPTGHLEANDYATKMVLPAPSRDAKPGSGTVSMGLFRTGLNFGQDSNFTLRATFRRPTPVLEGQGWTFAVVARDGDLVDEPDLSKIQLSFRIRPSDIQPRVQEVHGSSFHTEPIAVPLQKDVVAGNSELITLRLVVDRKAGIGNAFVTIGSSEQRVGAENFPLTVFGPGSDTIFKTAGVALATDTDWGKTLSVEVTDFRICTTTDHC